MCVRSDLDVFELLKHASSDTKNFHKSAQLVVFGDNPFDEDYFLFEITPALADQLLMSTGVTANIKSEDGNHGDNTAFFCTSKSTQRLLETETSNTLLVVPDLKIPSLPLDIYWSDDEPKVTRRTVSLVKSVYLELASIRAPSLRDLKRRLLPSSFAGHIEDDDLEKEMIEKFSNFDDLCLSVPCSEVELLYAVDRLNVFLWKGHCRMFQLDYISGVLQAIFDMGDELSLNWSQTGFPEPLDMISRLEDLYPASVLRQIFQRFFYRKKHSTSSSIYPRQGKICRLLGENLLSITKKFALSDFISVWCASVPRGLQPRLHRHLACAGRAYCEFSPLTQQKIISYLPSEDLPDDSIETRLMALFDYQSIWPESQLAGYVADLVVDNPIHEPNCLPLTKAAETEFFVLSESEDEDEKLKDSDELDDPVKLALDNPLPVPTVLGTLLNQHCRISISGQSGRCYTEKYPRR